MLTVDGAIIDENDLREIVNAAMPVIVSSATAIGKTPECLLRQAIDHSQFTPKARKEAYEIGLEYLRGNGGGWNWRSK